MIITNKDFTFINDAKNYSSKSQLNTKHGALLVSKNKIICRGFNHNRCRFGGSYKANDKVFKDYIQKNCCACHAEMDVLYKAILNLPKKYYFFKPFLKQSLFLQV